MPEPMLLPCPFCGGKPLTTPDRMLREGYEKWPDDPDAYAYSVRCNSCAAEGPWQKSASGAVTWWNLRSEPDATP